jgi:hypothetical protein
MFKDDVANESGDERNDEIRQGQDVVEGVSQGLAATAGDGEFAHQEIGIEEKNDESNLDDRPQNRLQASIICGAWSHGVFMLSRIGQRPDGGFAELRRFRSGKVRRLRFRNDLLQFKRTPIEISGRFFP